MAEQGISEPSRAIRDLAAASPEQQRLLLVLVRAMLAVSNRRAELEPLTDSLLHRLSHTAPAPVAHS